MGDLAGNCAPKPNWATLCFFEAGYTLVWIGWEFDVPDGTNMKLYAPVIRGHHRPGAIGDHVVDNRRYDRVSWPTARKIPYAVADAGQRHDDHVRDHVNSVRALTIPRDQWRFNEDATHRSRVSPTDSSRECIYEVIYTGKGSCGGRPGPRRHPRLHLLYKGSRRGQARAIGFGISAKAAASFANFLYDGFNADEQGHRKSSTACGRTSPELVKAASITASPSPRATAILS
jgi:hypothetical protein